MIVPSSYLLQDDHICTRGVRCRGGFATVSDGMYQGLTVAIKYLKTSEGDTDKIFKVSYLQSTRGFAVVQVPPALVPRDHYLETLVPSQHSAPARGFYLHRPTSLPHSHRVDAKWQYIGVRKIRSRGKPFAVGKPDHSQSLCSLIFIEHI